MYQTVVRTVDRWLDFEIHSRAGKVLGENFGGMALADELRSRKRGGCAGRVGAIEDERHLRVPVTEPLGIIGRDDYRCTRLARCNQRFDLRLGLHIVGNAEVVRGAVGIQQGTRLGTAALIQNRERHIADIVRGGISEQEQLHDRDDRGS